MRREGERAARSGSEGSVMGQREAPLVDPLCADQQGTEPGTPGAAPFVVDAEAGARLQAVLRGRLDGHEYIPGKWESVRP